MQKFFYLCLITAALVFVGCSDNPGRRGRRGEQMGPTTPPMSGSEVFADGNLLVGITIAQGYGSKGPGGDGSPGGQGGRGGGRHGGRRHGGDEGGMGMGGPPPDGGGYGGDDSGEIRPHMQESRMPPVRIQLHATNKGTEPIEITWVECKSPLGTFGVMPEKMTVAPGQTLDTEHMTSFLGASGEDMPVTVTLKVHGKTEQKPITVKITPPDASAGTPPPPPPPPDSSVHSTP